jgi:hypothetical protein
MSVENKIFKNETIKNIEYSISTDIMYKIDVVLGK